jgi:hypothetical protein
VTKIQRLKNTEAWQGAGVFDEVARLTSGFIQYPLGSEEYPKNLVIPRSPANSLNTTNSMNSTNSSNSTNSKNPSNC